MSTNETNSPNSEGIQAFLNQYSFDDLAKAFFALDLWIPNIASPLKTQYLYVLLEAVGTELPIKNKLLNYQSFKNFCEKLFPILPSFVMYEDYVPETDWGEIKYYLEGNFYKIFYGGDLSNPYDFYYAFETTHRPFEEEYRNLIERSPIQEMHFCLEVQDYILEHLKQDNKDIKYDISPGDISIPSKQFWNASSAFIKQFSVEKHFDNNILGFYSKEPSASHVFPAINVFESNAYRGQNCQYYFLKKGDSFYPVLPRRWLTVLYDKWGEIFKENFSNITKQLKEKRPNILIGIELVKFIQERIEESRVFRLAAPVKEDLTFLNDLIFTAVHSRDRIILVYVTPPIFNDADLSEHLNQIKDKLLECWNVLTSGPTRLHLAIERQVAGFRSADNKETLSPSFLIVAPVVLSSITGHIQLPEGINAEVMTLDQVTGIFDELESADELSDFFDYLIKERAVKRIFGPNSYLDHFGSFKDSHGILVPGAVHV